MLFVLMLPSLIFGGLTSSGNAGQPIVNDNSFIAQYRAAKAWGLNVEGCTASEPQRILNALSDGKLVVAIMTKGTLPPAGTSLSSGVYRMDIFWWLTLPATGGATGCGPYPAYLRVWPCFIVNMKTTGYARGSKKAMPMSRNDKPPTIQ